MIIVRLQGGIGNQMFQYAYGRTLSLRKKIEVKFDATSFDKKDGFALEKQTPRRYSLGAFKAVVPFAKEDELMPFFSAPSQLYRKIANKISFFFGLNWDPREGSYIEGNWPSQKYFLEYSAKIRDDFQLKNPLSSSAKSVQDEIVKSPKSVSIHVRRGDYVSDDKTAKYHGTCGPEYYDRAIEKIGDTFKSDSQHIDFFVFSDDIEWAKNNLKISGSIHYVSNGMIADHEEIHLMSLCNAHIIANSTFSWWGAWLDSKPDRIVIAPSRWTLKQQRLYKDTVPNNWIKI